jgi:hypothetical protein
MEQRADQGTAVVSGLARKINRLPTGLGFSRRTSLAQPTGATHPLHPSISLSIAQREKQQEKHARP